MSCDFLTQPMVEVTQRDRRPAIIGLVTTTANDLPDNIAALQAALIAERERAARVEAELAMAKAKASDDQP
jgi:hypothetical protein